MWCFIIAGKVRNGFKNHAHVDCNISPEAARYSGHNVILPRYARMIWPIHYKCIHVCIHYKSILLSCVHAESCVQFYLKKLPTHL